MMDGTTLGGGYGKDFKRDLRSSFGGVRGTLCHMMGAEWIWLERWKGVSPSGAIDEGEFADIVALRDRWTVIEQHRESWFKALKPEALAEIVHYRNIAGAEYVTLPVDGFAVSSIPSPASGTTAVASTANAIVTA